MFLRHPLFQGTVILTLAGITSRFLGFFYRVFLSRAIGAEGIGLYQLVFPVYMLACSITVSGISTSISRLVSARHAAGNTRGAKSILLTGIILSTSISLPVTALLFFFAAPISRWYLNQPSATILLRVMALAIPFGTFHACVDGYYLGMRNTKVPAIRQILEQMMRFLLLLPLYYGIFPGQMQITPLSAVFILVIEEAAAALFSFLSLCFTFRLSRRKVLFSLRSCASFLRRDLQELFTCALPITGNRVLVCVLQSLEASLLPVCLCRYTASSTEALRIYGILTGMALPVILFPTAVTSSLCSMLLPSVSAAWASGSYAHVRRLIRKSCFACLALGILFSVFFLLLGKPAAALLFQNELAGYYVQAFSFVCPLLYLNPLFFSILNGLGKSSVVFLYNLFTLSGRLLLILFVVPFWGITGYIAVLFLSQLFCCLLCLRSLEKLF